VKHGRDGTMAAANGRASPTIQETSDELSHDRQHVIGSFFMGSVPAIEGAGRQRAPAEDLETLMVGIRPVGVVFSTDGKDGAGNIGNRLCTWFRFDQHLVINIL